MPNQQKLLLNDISNCREKIDNDFDAMLELASNGEVHLLQMRLYNIYRELHDLDAEMRNFLAAERNDHGTK